MDPNDPKVFVEFQDRRRDFISGKTTFYADEWIYDLSETWSES